MAQNKFQQRQGIGADDPDGMLWVNVLGAILKAVLGLLSHLTEFGEIR